MTSISTTPESIQTFAQSYSKGLTDQTLNDVADLKNQKTNSPKFHEHAKATAEQFEAMFVSQMLSHMFSGIKTDEYFGGGQSEEIFRSLMIDEYGKTIAGQGGLGIADHIYRDIIQLQNVADNQNSTGQQ